MLQPVHMRRDVACQEGVDRIQDHGYLSCLKYAAARLGRTTEEGPMFSAYHRIGENRYRQRIGLDFEDFAPASAFAIGPA